MKKAILIAIMGVLVLTPAIGEAAKGTGQKSCPKGALCVWTKPNYEGKKLVLMAQDKPSNKVGNQINNKVSSVKSKNVELTYLFDEKDGEGDYRCFEPGTKVPDLDVPNWNFNNRATSSAVEPSDPSPCNV